MARVALTSALPVLLAACSTVSPADTDEIARLEQCADPADQAKLEESIGQLRQEQHADVLRAVRELIPRNAECARLAVLARRAVSLAPAGERQRELDELRGLFTSLRRKEKDPLAAANLDFALALFAGDEDEKRARIRKAVEVDPRHYYCLALQGEDLWLRGKLERAREVLTTTVTLRNSLAEGWLLLARVAEDRGLHRTAAKHYRAYLGLVPWDRAVASNYARLLVQHLRDGKTAEPLLEDLVRADPTNVEIGLHKGLALFLQERFDEAGAVYRALLADNPRDARIALSLGNLHLDGTGNLLKALLAYRYVLQLGQSDDLLTLLSQFIFVPSRIKDIEAKLRERGAELPKGRVELKQLTEV